VLQTSSGSHQRVKRRRKLAARFEAVDMRSRPARRLKEILADLVARYGEDANPDTLREIAVHRAALEAMQAEIVAGKPAASERAVRHSNVIVRLERELRAARRKSSKPAASGSTLADYIAAHYPQEDSGEAAGDHVAADAAGRGPHDANAGQRPP
jgi:hypothetical protein